MVQVSNIAKKIEPSRGRALFNMALQYKDVLNLTLGDPDLMPPEEIRLAGCEAIMEGKTRYSANAGLYDLRYEYSKYLSEKYGKSIDPSTEITVTVGGMEGLYLSLLCSINEGDEVILFAPYYMNYYQMIVMCGAIPIIVNTEEENDFIPNLEDLRNCISSKTKAIVLNSPNNPTGAVYPQDVIEKIIDISQEHQLLLISDEVYSSLVYDKLEHYSVMQSEKQYKNIIMIDSCSKRFCMTGWRVGFAVGPKEIILAMNKMQENIAACVPLPSQYAAIAAFRNKIDINKYCDEFEKRRNVLIKLLDEIEDISYYEPKGTFYLFLNIEKTGMKSMEFAQELLQEKQVAVVPGVSYGNNFDAYIRIAFTLDVDMLESAVQRIKEFLVERKSKKNEFS